MIDIEEIRALLSKPEWTEEEKQKVYEFVADNKSDELHQILQELYNRNIKQERKIDENVSASIYKELMQKVGKKNLHIKSGKVRNLWQRVAAIAACAIILIGASLFIKNKYNPIQNMYQTSHIENLIQPGQSGAILTLADGKTITIDNINNGIVSDQMGIVVRKTSDGQIIYQGKNSESVADQFRWNTLTTPRGRSFQVVLPDGTKVWLNADASLKYPIVFSGKQRNVQLSGEAYFEVAKNKSMPFIVDVLQKGKAVGKVKVLGTHFDIKAYDDDPSAQTTLLEGSVEFEKQNHVSQKITPGQQIIEDVQTGKISVNQIEGEDIIAWVNGNFNFHNTSLEEVMKQLARWYNVDIVYEKNIPDFTFNGSISRNSSLQKVLKVIELSGVRFKISGMQITVLAEK